MYNENTPEDELAAQEKLKEWSREGNAVTSLINSELGLLKTVLTAGSVETLKDHIFWRMCSFLDEDEAKDWCDCFYEAKDLYMSTDWVLSSIFALCSANRKIGKSNVISAVMETLSGSHRDMISYNQRDSRQSRGKSDEKGSMSG